MNTIKMKDGTEIFYKDWGAGQPIVFHHGWPLTADDWDLDLRDAIHVGHSTGGGEVARYVARHAQGRVAKAVLKHGDDDHIVPIADSALLSAKQVKNGTLKVYKGYPHGMCTIHPDVINADLFAFIKA
jgi:non-heme chloroperoxidase